MKSKIIKILHIILLIVICGMIVGPIFLKIKYPGTPFDELMFYLRAGVFNADMGVFTHAIKLCAPALLILVVLLYTIFYDITFDKKKLKIKNVQIYPFKIINNHRKIFTAIAFIFASVALFFNLGIYDYIKNNLSRSGFIAKHYVDPHTTTIRFDEKRNLIFIVVESLETSFFTKEQGGSWKTNVTPELYELLNDEDSITFYNKNVYQGVNQSTGASWTTASVVANSTGVPFKIPIAGNDYHSKNFMNGTYALGDLLKDNGYYNEVISASTTSFGGLKEYFTKHGKYAIIDADSYEKYGLEMDKNDIGGWGFNDNYLFEAAKQRLDVISKKNKPFNMELITIDTHPPQGYIGDYSINKFKTSYENAYATESKLIGDFVSWLKEQSYYKNTTIIIVGDHLNMTHDYFTEHGVELDNRYIYNCIINPAVKTENYSNRIVTALDFYPTTVAALGGKIDGNKLGLGVNLFSDQKTLAERFGIQKLNIELEKKSKFYDSHILDDGYINTLKRAEEKKLAEEEKQKQQASKKEGN